VNDGQATVYPGDFEYYAAKRGVDIETRGAVEGGAPRRAAWSRPPDRLASRPGKPERKRREAEERNARHRRTRELRDALAIARRRIEADTERELAELTERSPIRPPTPMRNSSASWSNATTGCAIGPIGSGRRTEAAGRGAGRVEAATVPGGRR
jgi:hypothetical protein